MNHLWISASAISFCSIFLKGFQHKNVIGNHYSAVFVTSWLMGACDVLAIGIISRGSWDLAMPVATSAAIGMIASMRFHDWLFKHKAKKHAVTLPPAAEPIARSVNIPEPNVFVLCHEGRDVAEVIHCPTVKQARCVVEALSNPDNALYVPFATKYTVKRGEGDMSCYMTTEEE